MTQIPTVLAPADFGGYNKDYDDFIDRQSAPPHALFDAEQATEAAGKYCEANHQITRDRLAVLCPLIYSSFYLTFGAWASWVAQSGCNEFVKGDGLF